METVCQDARGAVEENRGIETVGNRAGAGAGDTGRTNCERAHGGKEQKKNKMLGQHNITSLRKGPPVELTITQH